MIKLNWNDIDGGECSVTIYWFLSFEVASFSEERWRDGKTRRNFSTFRISYEYHQPPISPSVILLRFSFRNTSLVFFLLANREARKKSCKINKFIVRGKYKLCFTSHLSVREVLLHLYCVSKDFMRFIRVFIPVPHEKCQIYFLCFVFERPYLTISIRIQDEETLNRNCVNTESFLQLFHSLLMNDVSRVEQICYFIFFSFSIYKRT